MRRQLARLCLTVTVVMLVPLSGSASSEFSSASNLSAQSPVTLWLSPSSMTVAPSDTVYVAVMLDMAYQSHAVSVVKFKLDFDPLVLQPTAITLNDSLPQLEILEQTALGSGVGTVGLTLGIGADPQTALQMSSNLATVAFQAVGGSGASTWLIWDIAEALSVSTEDSATENVVGRADGAHACVGYGACEAGDTTPPSVTWVSPVTTEGTVYSTTDGMLIIEVLATDDSGISSVKFSRWDAVNLQTVDLGAVGSRPYMTALDVSTLNPGWNEIDADIIDNAHNHTYTYFWIDRAVTATAVVPGITRSGEDGTNVLLSWQHASNNTRYEVWGGALPYFTPGESGALLGEVTAIPWSFEDYGAIGDPNVHHFYLVRAYNGNVSADSGRVGEFQFLLVPGSP